MAVQSIQDPSHLKLLSLILSGGFSQASSYSQVPGGHIFGVGRATVQPHYSPWKGSVTFLAITVTKGLLKTTIAAALNPTILTSVPPNSDPSSISCVSIPGP